MANYNFIYIVPGPRWTLKSKTILNDLKGFHQILLLIQFNFQTSDIINNNPILSYHYTNIAYFTNPAHSCYLRPLLYVCRFHSSFWSLLLWWPLLLWSNSPKFHRVAKLVSLYRYLWPELPPVFPPHIIFTPSDTEKTIGKVVCFQLTRAVWFQMQLSQKNFNTQMLRKPISITSTTIGYWP